MAVQIRRWWFWDMEPDHLLMELTVKRCWHTAFTEHTFWSKLLENSKQKITWKDSGFPLHTGNLMYQSPELYFFVEEKSNSETSQTNFHYSLPAITLCSEVYLRPIHLLPKQCSLHTLQFPNALLEPIQNSTTTFILLCNFLLIYFHLYCL